MSFETRLDMRKHVLFLLLLLCVVACVSKYTHTPSLSYPLPLYRSPSVPPMTRVGVLSQRSLSLLSLLHFTDEMGGRYSHLTFPILRYGPSSDPRRRMMVEGKEEGVPLSDFVSRPAMPGSKEQVMIMMGSAPEMREAVLSLSHDLKRIYPFFDDTHASSLKLRLSKTPWEHGAHFDCGDRGIVQLVGERTVTTLPYQFWDEEEEGKKATTYPLYGLSPSELRQRGPCSTQTLYPGDLIELPTYLTHAVRGSSRTSDLPISICVSFLLEDGSDQEKKKKQRVCNQRFGEAFPERIRELQEGHL